MMRAMVVAMTAMVGSKHKVSLSCIKYQTICINNMTLRQSWCPQYSPPSAEVCSVQSAGAPWPTRRRQARRGGCLARPAVGFKPLQQVGTLYSGCTVAVQCTGWQGGSLCNYVPTYSWCTFGSCGECCRLFNDKDVDLILLIVVPDTGPNRLAETEMHLKCNVFNGRWLEFLVMPFSIATCKRDTRDVS